MKKLILVIFFISILTIKQTPKIQASGTATDSGNTSLTVESEDGIMYLTTEENQNSSQQTASTATKSAFSRTQINLPTGFATNFSNLINGVLSFVMVIAALLVFFYLIWGAFNWITSGGDKGKIDQARQKIIAAVVGLIIVASSFAIATLVTNFLGFESFNDVFENVRTIKGEQTDIQ